MRISWHVCDCDSHNELCARYECKGSDTLMKYILRTALIIVTNRVRRSTSWKAMCKSKRVLAHHGGILLDHGHSHWSVHDDLDDCCWGHDVHLPGQGAHSALLPQVGREHHPRTPQAKSWVGGNSLLHGRSRQGTSVCLNSASAGRSYAPEYHSQSSQSSDSLRVEAAALETQAGYCMPGWIAEPQAESPLLPGLPPGVARAAVCRHPPASSQD